MKFIVLAIGLLIPASIMGQTAVKKIAAVRIDESPKIDGRLDDACWQNITPVTDFIQYDPYSGAAPAHKTSVRIAYDNRAVYVAAMMYDTAPDSIYRELGNRDDDLNADYFSVKFDTYFMQSDAYSFQVSASGVQSDWRASDYTFNAVWLSAVRISDSGWAAEFCIPYSAIRFPNQPGMTWGIQFVRHIRRHRQTLQWSLEDKSAENNIVFWGKLEGIEDIKAPLRLSFTPYFAVAGQHYPAGAGESDISGSYSGGLDLKWGIDESYTLDMTLLPDFSQVRSDDLVKNITAFETKYDEYRSFFNEGIELFQKGDLFYSRRIGRTPQGYYSVYDSLRPGESMHENPSKAMLINATKVSGRSRKGSAVGIFNALTNEMHAVVVDSSGNKRRILTEPVSNYNIFVFDQVLKNNSDVYLINTNVMRTDGYDDANVTASGIILNDKTNTWQFSSEGALSQKFRRIPGDAENLYRNILGYRYGLAFAKVRGKFQFRLNHGQVNNTFDVNDMGLSYTYGNGETNYGALFRYNVYEPFGKVKEIYNTFRFKYDVNNNTGKMSHMIIEATNYQTFMNYLSLWTGAGTRPVRSWDFYEARYPGRFFHGLAYYYLYAGISTDYRKDIAVDFHASYQSGINDPFRNILAYIQPILSPGNRFSLSYKIQFDRSWKAPGFATFDSAYRSIFARRELMGIQNILSSRFMFMNDLSLSLRLRHYWYSGTSRKFYTLLDDGELEENPLYDNRSDYDFNYNAFNVDLVFSWQFAPGSALSLVWKNAILTDESEARLNYWDNIKHTFNSDQLNMISLKVLYYLDYVYLRKRNKAQ